MKWNLWDNCCALVQVSYGRRFDWGGVEIEMKIIDYIKKGSPIKTPGLLPIQEETYALIGEAQARINEAIDRKEDLINACFESYAKSIDWIRKSYYEEYSSLRDLTIELDEGLRRDASYKFVESCPEMDIAKDSWVLTDLPRALRNLDDLMGDILNVPSGQSSKLWTDRDYRRSIVYLEVCSSILKVHTSYFTFDRNLDGLRDAKVMVDRSIAALEKTSIEEQRRLFDSMVQFNAVRISEKMSLHSIVTIIVSIVALGFSIVSIVIQISTSNDSQLIVDAINGIGGALASSSQ